MYESHCEECTLDDVVWITSTFRIWFVFSFSFLFVKLCICRLDREGRCECVCVDCVRRTMCASLPPSDEKREQSSFVIIRSVVINVGRSMDARAIHNKFLFFLCVSYITIRTKYIRECKPAQQPAINIFARFVSNKVSYCWRFEQLSCFEKPF